MGSALLAVLLLQGVDEEGDPDPRGAGREAKLGRQSDRGRCPRMTSSCFGLETFR